MAMNPRNTGQPYMSNSLLIRQEIQRFESVHPSIYAIYDLIEAIPNPLIQQQVREHVVCIEDSFVNSQEWTLSRSVPDLKLGIVGSVNSGKSALVHRYLTGSYMQEESPEGGRFKKEVVIEGQSNLLLIRDEGGPPEMQFTHWVDAVIFVFSLENESSFTAVYDYYAKMANYRNTAEIPLILVGTQDSISESNPRVIDDTMARKLANDLKRCSYYETCATYGLNVERVFQDACQRVVAQKYHVSGQGTALPTTPNHGRANFYSSNASSQQSHAAGYGKPADSHSTGGSVTSGSGNIPTATPSNSSHNIQGQVASTTDNQEKEKKQKHFAHPAPPPQYSPHHHQTPLSEHRYQLTDQEKLQEIRLQLLHQPDFQTPISTPNVKRKNNKKAANGLQKSNSFTEEQGKDLPTPSSTPTQGRKARRRSNIFAPGKKDKNGLGSGRAIPVKQGYLYKKGNKGLNKEWKKKYVTLMDNGILTYHPSLHDYMDDSHGKEVNLVHTTVKIPGQKPRGSRPATGATGDLNKGKDLESNDPRLVEDSVVISNASIGPGVTIPNNNVELAPPSAMNMGSKIETPNVKKRHRRVKSSAKNDPSQMDDSDGYEFLIVSLDSKQWQFEAPTEGEREEWMSAIESQILCSLQGFESDKSKVSQAITDPAAVQSIKSVRGNAMCVDCMAADPDWASLNIGALMCIECSGIHRNLGTHVSRVRSLNLDEWPANLVAVMTSIGNSTANSVWESSYMTKNRAKPTPSTSREVKEQWIRSKYELKEFLPTLPRPDSPIGKQLIDSITRDDIRLTILILAHSSPDKVNSPYSSADGRRALHVAAALGKGVIMQLLLWYGADIRIPDHEGRNALWYARSANKPDCVEVLISNGCPESNTLPHPHRGANQANKLPQQQQQQHKMNNTSHAMYNQQEHGDKSAHQKPKTKKADVFDRLPASVI